MHNGALQCGSDLRWKDLGLKLRPNLSGALIFGIEGRVGNLKQVGNCSWVGSAELRQEVAVAG